MARNKERKLPTNIELAIRGENVQRLYGWYREERFEVNRRYQRKLVWTIDEKRAFIDSLLQGYPVPLILVAEYEREGETKFEIIDGMQRLNALTSFIEQDFDLNGKFFDLETMAETKHLLDAKHLKQRKPKLSRSECVQLAAYPIPLSVYRMETEGDVDEVFRRINSNGKHLSRQELRVAGNTGHFATLVRQLSSKLRGDSSLSDVLPLSKMKLLSISSKDLAYGLDVDKVFWVEEGVITKDQLRDSGDEELIADTLGYILLNPRPASSSEILNGFYGLEISDKENARSEDLAVAIQRQGADQIVQQYMAVFDVLKKAIFCSGKKFNSLMFANAGPRVPRYFQVVFLALHELLITSEKVPKSIEALSRKLDGIGRHIQISGGGRWSSKERIENVQAVTGILGSTFKRRTSTDPALSSWATELENLLVQSTTEQAAFDFKQGLHRLNKTNELDEQVIPKVVRTLSAMANHGKGAVGYVLLGVADRKTHSVAVDKMYGTESIVHSGFFISGVDGEISKNYTSSDDYLKKIVGAVKKQPVSSELSNQIARNIRLVRYFGKEVVVLKVEALSEPVTFDEKFYERHGSEVIEVKTKDILSIARRFL